MSEREKAIQLLNAIDDEKMVYVVGILENLTLENGTGQRFEGSTEEFFQILLEDESC